MYDAEYKKVREKADKDWARIPREHFPHGAQTRTWVKWGWWWFWPTKEIGCCHHMGSCGWASALRTAQFWAAHTHPQCKSRLEVLPWQRGPQEPHACPVLWIFERGLLGIMPTDLPTVLRFEFTLQIPTKAWIHAITVLGRLAASLVNITTPQLLEVLSSWHPREASVIPQDEQGNLGQCHVKRYSHVRKQLRNARSLGVHSD